MSKKKPKTILPVREPNGRLSRSIEALLEAKAPSEVKRLRDAALRKMAAPEWGSELGRLYLQGKIGPILFETGKRFGKLADLYSQVTGGPVDVSPSALLVAASNRRRRSVDPDSDAQAERERAITEVMLDVIAILVSIGVAKVRKPRMVELMLRVCQRNETCSIDSEVSDLKIALGWVANHWGLLGSRQEKRIGANVRSSM